MPLLNRLWLAFAGLNGAFAVGLGAYAAHGMADADPAAVALMDKATHYQLVHAVALVAVSALSASSVGTKQRDIFLTISGLLFSLGILLFCGSLYTIALGQWDTAGFAPFGGTSFIFGWISLSIAAIFSRTHRSVI